MAEIEVQMTSIGAEHEQCDGCNRCFERGETMSAVVSQNGEPMGWYCRACINDWRENGVNSRIFKR